MGVAWRTALYATGAVFVAAGVEHSSSGLAGDYLALSTMEVNCWCAELRKGGGSDGRVDVKSAEGVKGRGFRGGEKTTPSEDAGKAWFKRRRATNKGKTEPAGIIASVLHYLLMARALHFAG